MVKRKSIVIIFIALCFIVCVTGAYANIRTEAHSRSEIQEYRKKAAEYFQKRDFDTALDYLMKAIELGDKGSSTYALVGTMYKLKGRKREALEYYKTALVAAQRELAFTKALTPKPEVDAGQVQQEIDKLIAKHEYNVALIKKSIASVEPTKKKRTIGKEKAIAIAKEYAAKKKGKNVAQHKKITATYDEAAKTWDVSFMMNPAPPGGYFDVIIDGETGEVVNFFPGL